ncbi:MAG: TetR/AcrR family transcriptional regulator [Burkholderiaceae bacterium]|nr:MAG: TetR/AcrR family transcriptional regulator [Burkholderiaceae bacterium]
MAAPHSTTTHAPAPRWERRKEARPTELLSAALDLFVEKGYAATRLDDVAAQAGVSKGTLYLYYVNKEELFKAVVRQNIVPLVEHSEKLADEFEGDSAMLLRLLVQGWWERFINTRLSGISKLMISESGNFPELARFYHDEVIQRAHALMASVLERGMARGEFRYVDVRSTVQVLHAPVVMLSLWRNSFDLCCAKTLDAQAYLNSYVDLALSGLSNFDYVDRPPGKNS